QRRSVERGRDDVERDGGAAGSPHRRLHHVAEEHVGRGLLRRDVRIAENRGHEAHVERRIGEGHPHRPAVVDVVGRAPTADHAHRKVGGDDHARLRGRLRERGRGHEEEKDYKYSSTRLTCSHSVAPFPMATRMPYLPRSRVCDTNSRPEAFIRSSASIVACSDAASSPRTTLRKTTTLNICGAISSTSLRFCSSAARRFAYSTWPRITAIESACSTPCQRKRSSGTIVAEPA